MDNLIKTTKVINPKCYAYTHPGVPYHDGYIKIGYTEEDTADIRIKNQHHTAGIKWHREWWGRAVFDEDGKPFLDTDFHAYLRKNGIKQPQDEGRLEDFDNNINNEWFHTDGDTSKRLFDEFKQNKGIIESNAVMPYTLRTEQKKAVEDTKEYFLSHERPEFLWNAKPRFGKTLSTYDLAKSIGALRVLIVTNRPVISTSWYDDYEKFLGTESGYYFVSDTDSLKDKPLVISRDKYISESWKTHIMGCMCFTSLQDLKGSMYFGGRIDKLKYIADITWDLLVIDEAHEGVDTYKTDTAFRQIHRKYTLHLSGTPFKAIANDKFGSEAIFNWTYADEQQAKRDWDNEEVPNPYLPMPKLNMLTYKMSDAVRERIEQGADFNDDGDNDAYFYDMNEFFKTTESGKFVHEADVDKFLDALTTKKNFPFTEAYRDEIKHTLWMVGSDVPTRSAKALVDKLSKHEVFKHYKIIPAFGGKGWNDDESEDSETFRNEQKNAFKAVKDAIANYDRTITVSVGKLTTGVTVPDWTAVMMLSNCKSASLYIQTTFRVQNPCKFTDNDTVSRKENCYVFDFDPARTLNIYEQFANDLYADTANGKGDTETRKKHIHDLLNFFPVYSEDKEGEMIPLDEEKVLSIPRAIHAQEVVRKGFMSNFLFQNISGIFSAPAVVKEIINKFEAVKEPVGVIPKAKDLNINPDGEVEIPESTVVGMATEIFGDKIYSDEVLVETEIKGVIDKGTEDIDISKIKEILHNRINSDVATVKEDTNMTKTLQNALTRELNRDADKQVDNTFVDFTIKKNTLEQERKTAVEQAQIEGKTAEVLAINKEYDEKQAQSEEEFLSELMAVGKKVATKAKKDAVEAVEKSNKEAEKKEVEDTVRDHLRGFSRTIPSFLMGYGDENTKLETFDKIIPEEVFEEVTGITVTDFKFLRDGGEYPDPDDPTKTKHFDGHLFEPIVFNDSVKEFIRKRNELADYFKEDLKEDIFDYIPPQKTNQIFTPKTVVKEMVDYLEKENPGCFDNPDKTFIDLYMKSGLYITEIVKRLYRSEKMKELYPDNEERLKHIFGNQVYGLAPTEIIYAISTHYILGFAEEHKMTISSKHFKMLDALPYAQGKMDMTLEQKLDELFGGEVSATD